MTKKITFICSDAKNHLWLYKLLIENFDDVELILYRPKKKRTRLIRIHNVLGVFTMSKNP